MTPKEKDKSYIWHPFTQQKGAAEPIHIERAEGCYLYTSDGRKYLDAISSWWVNIHGHSNPYIAERIAQQARELEHVIFAGFTHTPAIDLAEKLIQTLANKYSKVFFSDNGSTSVEVALKMAFQYWYNLGEKNKTKVIALENAYHGDTFGAMSVGERSTFNAPFNDLMFDVYHLPIPTAPNLQIVQNKLERLLQEGNVAAFIFEPLVQGAGGMKMHLPEHLDALLKIAKKHGIICIADEVMTGFGRTGRNFATEYLNESIDIICLSKGITGGFMPLGVTLCSENIYEAFYSNEAGKTFFHGHSYTANPLACAASIASMKLLTGLECQNHIAMISDSHKAFINQFDRHDSVKDIRSTGTILAIEIGTEEDTSYFNSIRNEIYDFCLQKGVLLRPLGNVLYVMPPYCIKKSELNHVYEVLEEVIDFARNK